MDAWNVGKRIQWNVVIFGVLFATIILVFSVASHNFLTTGNLLDVLKHVSIIAIASLGLTFVIIVGHLDLSFYLNSCFAAMAMSWLISLGWNVYAAILVGLLAGMVLGLFSGLAVGLFHLPDVIVTIAIGAIAFGGSYIFSNGMFIFTGFLESGIATLNNGSVLGISVPVLIMAGIFLLAYLLLENTKTGRMFYATGYSKKVSRFSGLNVTGIVVTAFVISSALTALGAMIATSAKGNGDVSIAVAFLLPCYTSVYLGAAIFKRPGVIGTLSGAVFMEVITDGFTLLNVPYYITNLVASGLLIAAILVSVLKLSQRRHATEYREIQAVSK